MTGSLFGHRLLRLPRVGLPGAYAAEMIDLQSHSTVSDGQLEPAGVVEAAAAAGVEVLALTDHDAVAGVTEAAAAAERLGLELVPAIEMSCVHEFADDLHICGYWIDLEVIASACERAQRERVNRAEEIISRLRREGFELTLDDAIAEAGDALSIGRPHIARAAGATGNLGPFFEEYLVPGGPRLDQLAAIVKPQKVQHAMIYPIVLWIFFRKPRVVDAFEGQADLA